MSDQPVLVANPGASLTDEVLRAIARLLPPAEAKPTSRLIDSPYLTVDEAAAYCRRSRKTILNHHSLGNIRSMPQTRPPLFKREDLDDWLTGRKPRRKS